MFKEIYYSWNQNFTSCTSCICNYHSCIKLDSWISISPIPVTWKPSYDWNRNSWCPIISYLNSVICYLNFYKRNSCYQTHTQLLFLTAAVPIPTISPIPTPLNLYSNSLHLRPGNCNSHSFHKKLYIAALWAIPIPNPQLLFIQTKKFIPTISNSFFYHQQFPLPSSAITNITIFNIRPQHQRFLISPISVPDVSNSLPTVIAKTFQIISNSHSCHQKFPFLSSEIPILEFLSCYNNNFPSHYQQVNSISQ